MLVGVEHAVPQRTIIRHEQQSFSIPVESSERVEAFDVFVCEEVDNRRMFLVGRSRDDALRFIQHIVLLAIVIDPRSVHRDDLQGRVDIIADVSSRNSID